MTLTLDPRSPTAADRASSPRSSVPSSASGQSLEIVLSGILAGGHVLMEDFPGLGKTLAARSFAQALGLDFARAQFTPDLLPSDLTGSFLYDQRTHEFTFRKGPLFTGLLLADEINRTPPKTQSALLEAMQEGQVTVEGETFALPQPFHVLATANPVEYEGTYPLPEAQLDRFLLRVSFGYPTAAEEWEVLQRRMARQPGGPGGRQRDRRRRADRDAAGGRDGDRRRGGRPVLRAARRRDPVSHQNLLMGASPRGSLALLLTSGRMPCCAAATTSPPRTSRPSRTPASTTASPCDPSCG